MNGVEMVDPRAFVRLIRPVNCIMMGFAILVGAVICGGTGLLTSGWAILLAVVTGFTVTGSAMAINDYYDRDIDFINEPHRPIPSGAISPREALSASLLLGLVGLTAALFTSLGNLVLAFLAWLAAMVYNTVGKGTGFPGNFLVSSCVAVPFIYGGIIAGNSQLNIGLIFSLIAFLTNMGREVTKGIVDMIGDRALGIRTIAVSKGARFAAGVSAAFYLSAVIASVVPYLQGVVSFWYIPFVTLTDLGLIYLSISIIRDSSRENSRNVKNHVLLLMMSGLIGFLLGNLL